MTKNQLIEAIKDADNNAEIKCIHFQERDNPNPRIYKDESCRHMSTHIEAKVNVDGDIDLFVITMYD